MWALQCELPYFAYFLKNRMLQCNLWIMVLSKSIILEDNMGLREIYASLWLQRKCINSITVKKFSLSLGSSINYIFSLKNGHDLFFNVSLGSLIAVLNEIDFLDILQSTIITKEKIKGMEENDKEDKVKLLQEGLWYRLPRSKENYP